MTDNGAELLEICNELYFDNPIGFANDVLGIDLSEQQEEVAQALVDFRKVVVKSGHGTGKSCLQSVLILWFMATRPYCRVILTAPSHHQLQNILWSEVQKWYNTSLLEVGDVFTITREKMSLNEKGLEKVWYAVPISVSNPEALSGHHAEHVLYVLDESAGIDEELIQRIEGALTTDGSYFISMGNPSFRKGTLFNLCTKYSHMYRVLTLNSENSPHVTKEYIDFMAEKYGVDSDVYRVRVLGEFPLEDTLSLFNEEYIKESFSRKNIADEYLGYTSVGIDVSAMGGDSFVVSVVEGNEELERFVWKETNFRSSARMVIERLRKYFIKGVVRIKVDSTGLGIGFAEMLDEEIEKNRYKHNIDLECINFSRKASQSDRFSDVVTEMYFGLSSLIGKIKLVYNDVEDSERILEQLKKRRFTFDSTGRFKISNKKDFIREFGFSPDESDAIALAFYEPVERVAIYSNI